MATTTDIDCQNKARRMALALGIARSRIYGFEHWKINSYEKIYCRMRLNTAHELLSRTNSKGNIETRWLWPHSRVGTEAHVEAFFKQPRFETLGAIVEVSFAEIQSELEKLHLNITTDLQTFYEVYLELLSEETRAVKSST